MIFRRREFQAAAFSAALAWGVVDCGSVEAQGKPIPITIAQSSTSIGYSINLIAVDGGFYSREGLAPETTIVGGGEPDTVAALRSGSVQFGALTLVTALQAAARGAKFSVVAPFVRESVDQFVINAQAAKKAGITQTMSLREKFQRAKGMTVATYEIGGSFQPIFESLARDYSVDPHSFTITAIKSFPGMLAATKRGEVEISLLAIPFGAVGLRDYGLQMFADFWHGQVPEFRGMPYEGLVVNRSYADQNPDVVARVHRALSKTLRFMHDHPDKVVDLMRKRSPGLGDELLREFYVQDEASFAQQAIIDRASYKLIQDFVVHAMNSNASQVSYESFVLPIAQEK